jgi:predicted secreted protein
VAQNAIHVADALTLVMESNNVPELSNMRALPAIPNDIVMTLQENQTQNVLASLQLPPPQPPPL